MIHIKMSQIQDDYDISMSTPEELNTEIEKQDTELDKLDPYLTPKDDLASDIAKQWAADMVRVGPDLFVDSKIIELFRKLKAVGFNLLSKDNLFLLGSLFVDTSLIFNEISWMDDDEFGHLMAYIAAMPSKLASVSMRSFVAQAVGQLEQLQLMQSLADIGLDVQDESKLLSMMRMLVNSPASPFKNIAQSVLQLDPNNMSKLMGVYDDIVIQKLDKSLPTPTRYVNPNARDYSPQHEVEEDDNNVDEPERAGPRNKIDFKKKPRPPGLEIPEQVSELGIQKFPGDLRSMYNEYHLLQEAIANKPGIKPLAKGERSHLKVLPEMKSKNYDMLSKQDKLAELTVPISGGQCVRSYMLRKNAIVVGETDMGELAVFMTGAGEFDLWTPLSHEVRFSTTQYRE